MESDIGRFGAFVEEPLIAVLLPERFIVPRLYDLNREKEPYYVGVCRG